MTVMGAQKKYVTKHGRVLPPQPMVRTIPRRM